MSDARDFKVVGTSAKKLDGPALAKGKPMFVADLCPPGTLRVKILGSPHAHARIKSIDVSKAEAMEGVHHVAYYANVPRVAHTTAGQGYPEPSAYDTFVFDKKVRFIGDRVAAVAADTEEIALEALKAIEVEYEVLPAVLDPRHAMDDGAPIIHDEPEAKMIIPVPYDPSKNLAAGVETAFGDVDAALEKADAVVEGEWESHYAQHCPMEPHISMAYMDAHDRVVIVTSTQVPFHARRLVAQALDLPVKKIHVIKPRIGGGFGTKQEVLLEDVTALMAMRTGKPVLLELTREEEFVSSRTRHPQILKVRAGATKDGKVAGIEMDIIMNTGAYGSHALTVICNSGSKILPLYRWPTVKFRGNSVYTNLPVGGAYRGYGATQGAFAVECLMDELAEKLGIDPVEFRRINHIVTGESSPIFAVLGEGKPGVEQFIGSCGLPECLTLGAEAIGWEAERARPRDTGRYRRGVGMCALMQGSSIPEIDMGAASIKMNEDGTFNLLMGATDLGTGSDTILAQIAAEVLGCDTDDFIVLSSDTDVTPFDVGAYASSTTYLTGSAVIKTAEKVAVQIREVAAKMLSVEDPSTIVLEDKKAVAPSGESKTFSEIALHSLYVADQFQIGAIGSHITHKSPPPFSAHFAYVEVDTLTGKVELLHYASATDCGTAINPKLAEGQIEGAVMNGLSFALTEEYVFDDKGRMRNPSFDHYKIFSTADMPKLTTILVPTYEETGPMGAKSVSEICINGPMPAIANAIAHACGARVKTGPFSAERVLAAFKAL